MPFLWRSAILLEGDVSESFFPLSNGDNVRLAPFFAPLGRLQTCSFDNRFFSFPSQLLPRDRWFQASIAREKEDLFSFPPLWRVARLSFLFFFSTYDLPFSFFPDGRNPSFSQDDGTFILLKRPPLRTIDDKPFSFSLPYPLPPSVGFRPFSSFRM